jgi:hypothetical protein
MYMQTYTLLYLKITSNPNSLVDILLKGYKAKLKEIIKYIPAIKDLNYIISKLNIK